MFDHSFSGRTRQIEADAHRIVREALERHEGPGDRAFMDVLWAYIHAPEGGRDALFLAVASHAVGAPVAATVSPPSPAASSHPDRGPFPRMSAPSADPGALADFVRATLALIQSLQPQNAGG